MTKFTYVCDLCKEEIKDKAGFILYLYENGDREFDHLPDKADLSMESSHICKKCVDELVTVTL